jgi:16S rRNA (uracil1498-N3)-methyltransferase
MTRPRFLVAQDLAEASELLLSSELAHRAARVLRLRPGDQVVLFDGSGLEAEAVVTAISAREVGLRILQRSTPPREAPVRVVLYQALIAATRFELVLEKGTELGVQAFVPTVCARCTSRPAPAHALAGKLARWRAVTVAAAEQSGRTRLPEVSKPLPLEEALASSPGPKLFAWEHAVEPLPKVLEHLQELHPQAVSLFVGPEGGFTAEEAALARSCGAVAVSLGPRTLRAETAAIVLCALSLLALGGLAPPAG